MHIAFVTKYTGVMQMNTPKTILTILLPIFLIGIILLPLTMAYPEEQTVAEKDIAQLKLEALEKSLGEEGRKNVEKYLELQASLPSTVKLMPYRALAFAGTLEECRLATYRYIDELEISEKEKNRYREGIEDIWKRYPDKISKEDYDFMNEIGPLLVNASLKNYQPSPQKWLSTQHQDYAYYACDGSSYRNYAKNAADDPDNGIMDPEPYYRYYNHYEDGLLHIGGAPGRCQEFTNSAISAINSGNQTLAHERFGYASHYLTDPGIPFHSTGVIRQGVNYYWNSYETTYHAIYEDYIDSQWISGYKFKDYVQYNTQSITITNPEVAVEDNAEHSSQYFDYIWAKMSADPQNFGTDIYVAYYTAQCVQKCAKYTHGLYDYIM